MSNDKLVKRTTLSLVISSVYALAHCFVGFYLNSWWYLFIGIYYIILSITRFSVLQVKKKVVDDIETELFAKKITGILLVFLSLSLVDIVILSGKSNHGIKHNLIIMIALALYAFTKITLAIIGLVKAKKEISPVATTLRNISFADALVAIFSLQRSMLISFPGMNESEIKIMNVCTGTAVMIIIFILGINLIKQESWLKNVKNRIYKSK